LKESAALRGGPTDELWAIHEEIASLLSARMHAEKLKLEKRLNDLARKFGKL
jgi:hypothetical protein